MENRKEKCIELRGWWSPLSVVSFLNERNRHTLNFEANLYTFLEGTYKLRSLGFQMCVLFYFFNREVYHKWKLNHGGKFDETADTK